MVREFYKECYINFYSSVVKQGGKTIDFIQGENSQTLAVELDEYILKTLGNELNKQYDLLGDEVENWEHILKRKIR